MQEDIRIRRVAVEFLRPGPPHNQLLSPLTQYLAVCGDAGAGEVSVPYEHAGFERRLKELRYETGDPGDREAMLHDIGVEMAKILGAVPGLPGSLTLDAKDSGTMVHLRLTLSAAELAYLPFELAKVPVTATTTADSFLSIQSRPPVCVTRTIRTVSSEGMAWPIEPRILFISGDPDNVPFQEHREVLINAISDFQYPSDAIIRDGDGPSCRREKFGTLLTILENPTLAQVLAECHETPYTHVHILTHGDQYGAGRDLFGLVLSGPDGEADVVTGERFASALTSVHGDRIHRPTVVTVASCDSGNVGTVMIPGASFAHALHQSGIPLVVASQFPLSKEGSIPLARVLYEGLLRGDNPLVLLQRLRSELHARYTSMWHDWASLVVYEALPQALGEQLDALRYRQTRRAMNAALEHIDRVVLEPKSIAAGAKSKKADAARRSLADLDKAVDRAVDRLPFNGQYGIECFGLRASARKRLAQAAFLFNQNGGGKELQHRDPYDLLEQAWVDYDLAARGLLVSPGRVAQRVASLHWVLTQFVSISAVLGKDHDEERWSAAKLCAGLYRNHADREERAWAHASLAELWLLQLARPDSTAAQRQQFAKSAVDHAAEVVRADPTRLDFTVTSTRLQFQRYIDWWGSDRFLKGLERRELRRPIAWGEGLLDTAKSIVRVLEPPKKSGGNDDRGGADDGGTGDDGGSSAMQLVAEPPAPGGGGRGAQGPPLLRAERKETALLPGTGERQGLFFDIAMLPAGHGDALWIEYGEGKQTHRLLVDCGTQGTAKLLLRLIDGLSQPERMLELFVMSHIDSDHIGGALPFLKAAQRGLLFGDVWFNGWRHLSGQLGAKQGEMFSTAIQDLGLRWNAWREGDAIMLPGDDELPEHTLPGGMKLTLLSPGRAQLKKLAPVWTKELKRYGLEPGGRVDYSRFLKGTPTTSTDVDQLADTPFAGDGGAPNGSSIALLAEFGGASALLAADAHAPVLLESIGKLIKRRGVKRLAVDAFKVSHHGSQNNVSNELVRLLDCRRYLLSSNGSHFAHPDRQAVARIIKHGGTQPSLHFNYESKFTQVWKSPELQEKYSYSACYPQTGGEPLVVSLPCGSSRGPS